MTLQKTRVVHCEKDQYDVYIGRPSKWGNPFTESNGDTRTEVIRKYKEWLLYDWDGGFLIGVISGIISTSIAFIILFSK